MPIFCRALKRNARRVNEDKNALGLDRKRILSFTFNISRFGNISFEFRFWIIAKTVQRN